MILYLFLVSNSSHFFFDLADAIDAFNDYAD